LLAALRKYLSETGRGHASAPAEADPVQLAAAGLLFHVIAIDGVVSDDERTMLADLLSRRFGLDVDAAMALAGAGESADNEAVDLYGFTSVLKRTLPVEERARIIEMMWKLVYADGSVHEFEDNAVWRVAELLAVPSETRIRLKQSVRGNARS
jgi:uncharacterized tellurite resistance protein B-like protein